MSQLSPCLGGVPVTYQLAGVEEVAGAFLLHVRLLAARALPSRTFVPRDFPVPAGREVTLGDPTTSQGLSAPTQGGFVPTGGRVKDSQGIWGILPLSPHPWKSFSPGQRIPGGFGFFPPFPALPAGSEQLPAAVEAELQVVSLQLRLLHAHRLILRAVVAKITAGRREKQLSPRLGTWEG